MGRPTSYQLFEFEKGYDENLFVFKFKTTGVAGLLLFSGPESGAFSDFVAVSVVDGYLECRASVSGGAAFAARSEVKVNTGAWVTAWVSRQGLTLTVQINDGATVVATGTGPVDGLDVSALLYVGGTPETVPAGVAEAGLDGCMDTLMVDGIDLRAANSGLLVKESDIEQCEQPHFHGAEQILFSTAGLGGPETTPAPVSSVRVEFSFEADAESTGNETLFFAGPASGSSDGVAVFVRSGRLGLAVMSGGEQVVVWGPAEGVAAQQWYRVQASVEQGTTTLVVDEVSAVSLAGPHHPLALSGERWLGGVAAGVAAGLVAGLGGLHGCMRNIALDGARVSYGLAAFQSTSLTSCEI